MAISRISRIEPTAFSHSASRRGLRHLSFRGWPSFSPPQRTAQQLFEMAMAKDLERKSFMDKLTGGGKTVFSGGWHGVEWALDKVMRPTYAFAEAVRREEQYKKEHPGDYELFKDPGNWLAAAKAGAKGFSRGIQGKRKTTYSDVIKEYGWLKGHGRLRGTAGFVADVALDPTTYVSFGTTAVAKGGAKGGLEAAQVAGRHAIEDKVVGKSASRHWGRAMTTLKAAGKTHQARLALATERKRLAGVRTVDEGDRAYLSQLGEAAFREERLHSDRILHIGAGKAKIPTHLKIPQLGNILVKTPVLGGPFGRLREGFRAAVGSGKTDIMRGVRVTAKHTMERLSGKYISDVREFLKDMPRKLDTDRAIKTLSRFEQKGSVIKKVGKRGDVKYVLNERKIKALKKAGEMTDDEEKFLRGWHDIAQHFYHQDRAFGIQYQHMGEQGRLYVPHLMDRVGLPYTVAQKNMLKKQGYTKGRKNSNLSLEHIATLVKEGKLPREIETNPYKMLTSMARSRAHQHADQAALNFVQRAFGVPMRVVTKDAEKKIGKTEQRIQELDVKMKGYDTPGKRNLKQYKAMAAEKKKAEASLKKLKRGKKNKEASSDMVDIGDLRDKWGNKIRVEPEIAAALKRVEKIVDPTEDVAVGKFMRGWANMTGRWKLLVTAVNPGYRVRNTLSDFWNMYVAGVPTWAMGRYGARAAKIMRDAKGGRGVSRKAQEDALRIINDAYDAGILSGLFGGDIDTIALMLKAAGSKRSLAKRGRMIRLGSKVAQDMNRNAENWGRMVHYLYRREHQKMSIADSAFEVKKAHFDYEDLTDFERKKLKVFIPFYTWTRKNIPYQIQALVSRPGKYSTFPKFAIEANKAAGGEEGEIVPEYMANNFSFKVPVGKHTYFTPQLGMADLARFGESRDSAFANAMAMVHPAIKIPFEIRTNKSLFTGQEINPTSGHPRQPISDWAAPILSLIPGSNVGKTKRGDKVGMGASPWLTYAFGQSPWTRSIFLGGKIKSEQRGYSNWWGQLGGVQITKLDPKQQIILERMALKEKLKRRIRGLRDEGLYPESEIQRNSDYERTIQRLIAQGLSR